MKRKNKTKRNKIKRSKIKRSKLNQSKLNQSKLKRSKLKRSKLKRNKRHKTKRTQNKIRRRMRGGAAAELDASLTRTSYICSLEYPSEKVWNHGKEPIEDSDLRKGQEFRVILNPWLFSTILENNQGLIQFIKKGSKSETEKYDGKCKGEIKSVGWVGTKVILNNDHDKIEVSLNDLKEVAYMELLSPDYKLDEYHSSSDQFLLYVREIGSGSYGRVILCRHPSIELLVGEDFELNASNIKSIVTKDLNEDLVNYPLRAVKLSKDKEGGQRLIFEYEIMKELKESPKEYTKFFPEAYIVLHNDPFLEQKGIVMEYLRPHTFTDGSQPSNLRELLESGFKLSPNHKQHYCRDLAYGIAAMHSVKIWHGDLKPENIVIAHDGSKMGQLKIIDFDSCSHTFKPRESPGFDINCCHTHPINGTSLYLPPENNSEYSHDMKRSLIELGPSYDWWTYGLIVFEITTGKVAYSMDENGKPHGEDELESKDHNQMYAFLQGKSQMYVNLAKNESERGKFLQNLGISLDPGNKALLDLAFMFFKPRDTRPFLCLDGEQMISYGGEESREYQSIVDGALSLNQ